METAMLSGGPGGSIATMADEPAGAITACAGSDGCSHGASVAAAMVADTGDKAGRHAAVATTTVTSSMGV